VYAVGLALVSVLFGLFWVETANMDAKSVAGQLSDSGLQIPGFRRDPRMLETILNKHIFPLTVMGSLCVGLLAAIADLTGAIGTGTGILLTVGILHKMYEQLEQMNAFEMYPSFGKLFGE
jgi:preprotein translocase subunit SecY